MLILAKDTTRVILSGGEFLQPEERDAIAERLSDQLGVKCVFVPEEFTLGNFSGGCKESCEEVNDLRKMLNEEREQSRKNRCNYRRAHVDGAVSAAVGFFIGTILTKLLLLL